MDRKHWTLIPTSTIGGLDFGRDRTVVKKELGEPTRTIRKTVSSKGSTDVYQDFHVHYNEHDKMEAIEFFTTDICLYINSQKVFPGTLCTAKEILPDLEECFGSYVSKSASIGIYIEGESIISILVGCRNYYQ